MALSGLPALPDTSAGMSVGVTCGAEGALVSQFVTTVNTHLLKHHPSLLQTQDCIHKISDLSSLITLCRVCWPQVGR